MRGELDYYSTRSGLPAGTLADHKLGYFKTVSGITAGSLADHMAAFFSTQGKGSVLANMYAYYSTQTASSGTLDDIQQNFLLNPPSGGPTAGTAITNLVPLARTFSYNNVADNATTMTLTPNANTQPGDVQFAVIAGTTTPTTVTPPAGWTLVSGPTTSGSLTSRVYSKVRAVGDTTYVFTFDAGGGNVVGALAAFARGTTPLVIGAGTSRSVDLTNTAASITTTAANTMVATISTERTTTTEAAVTSATNTTQLGFALQAGSAIETIFVGYRNQAVAGATPVATVVYPNTQATNGWAVQIGVPPKAYTSRVTDIATWAAQTDAYIAHRGLSRTFPEMTKFAYDEAINYGVNAIEVSVHKSASGTFWCNHDADLTASTDGANTNTILSQTDAALAVINRTASATTNTAQVAQPLTRLSDVLAAYGDNVVIFIEDKTYANQAALITYLQTFPHWKERFVWKQAGTGTKYPIPAGMKSWGYFFDADAANFAAKQGQWDYIGIDFNSSDATLTPQIALAGAARTIAHILPNTTQRDRFQGLGVHKFMASDISLVPAV